MAARSIKLGRRREGRARSLFVDQVGLSLQLLRMIGIECGQRPTGEPFLTRHTTDATSTAVQFHDGGGVQHASMRWGMCVLRVGQSVALAVHCTWYFCPSGPAAIFWIQSKLGGFGGVQGTLVEPSVPLVQVTRIVMGSSNWTLRSLFWKASTSRPVPDAALTARPSAVTGIAGEKSPALVYGNSVNGGEAKTREPPMTSEKLAPTGPL